MSRLEPEQLLEQPQGDAQVAVLLEESPPEATHEVIQRLRDQYTYDRMIAIRKASKIQRELRDRKSTRLNSSHWE